MSYCKFSPDGLFVYKWSGDLRKDVRRRAKRSTVLTHLRTTCHIEEGTTLGDIFRAVGSYKYLTAFISQYSWCRCIEEFHAQAEEPMRSEEQNLEYLEIGWKSDATEYMEKVKHPGGLRERTRVVAYDAHADFYGVGKPGTADYRPDGRERYSVSYSPMYDLADLPVKLNEEFIVYTPLNAVRGEPYKPQESLLTAKRGFTLLEVLDAIYDDISFMGGPQENAEFIEEMTQRVEDIKNGTAECVPLEDAFRELEGK